MEILNPNSSAITSPKNSAQHGLDLERVFLDLVFILSFFPIAIEEGPGQSLFNMLTENNVLDFCTFEPASDTLLRIWGLSLDIVHKLAKLFLGV
ncbi:hypothetical protein MBLNU13_g06607t1 [Cladosporium sp. NU13]